jgi:hypothetical protein
MVMMNVPGGKPLKLYTPLPLLVVVCFSFVAVLVSASVAPGIAAPLGSVTTP